MDKELLKKAKVLEDKVSAMDSVIHTLRDKNTESYLYNNNIGFIKSFSVELKGEIADVCEKYKAKYEKELAEL